MPAGPVGGAADGAGGAAAVDAEGAVEVRPRELTVPRPSMPAALSEVQPMELGGAADGADGAAAVEAAGAVGGAADGVGGAAGPSAPTALSEVRPMGLGVPLPSMSEVQPMELGVPLPSTPTALNFAERPIADSFENPVGQATDQ